MNHSSNSSTTHSLRLSSNRHATPPPRARRRVRQSIGVLFDESAPAEDEYFCENEETIRSFPKLAYSQLPEFDYEEEDVAAMKGKLIKKLKQIKPIASLNHQNSFLLHANAAAEGYVDAFLKTPILKAQAVLFSNKNLEKKSVPVSSSHSDGAVVETEVPKVIDVVELMKDLDEDEEERESGGGVDVDDDKENAGPCCDGFEKVENFLAGKRGGGLGNRSYGPLTEINVSSFRRPDLNSATLFDPNLLAAFKTVVKEHVRRSEECTVPRIEGEHAESNPYEPPPKNPQVKGDPLSEFEKKKCPQGDSDSVIFYTTSLRGIRKTFEDCCSVRFLLDSFRVTYYERDVSMHSKFKEELREILGGGGGKPVATIVPPRLFIRGRYIGGAEDVLSLHERGKFRPLFEGVPQDQTRGHCDCCAGIRFILCCQCSGSHRIVDGDSFSSKCTECNENGLIVCPMCC